MLLLSRKSKEQIHVGDNIMITILKVKGNSVRIGIEAPREVRVLRGELPSFDVVADESDGRCSAEPAAATQEPSSEDEASIPMVSSTPMQAFIRNRCRGGNRHVRRHTVMKQMLVQS